DRRSDFVEKAPVHIHIRAQGIHQDPATAVVEKKGHVHAFVENGMPFVLIARFCPLPCLDTIVEARVPRYRSGENAGTYGRTVDFNEPDGRAANAGKRGVQNQALEAQLAEPAPEQIDPQKSADTGSHSDPCAVRTEPR